VDREPVKTVALGAAFTLEFCSGAATQAGVRMQLAVSFPALPIVLLLDLFPGDASRGGSLRRNSIEP
jgi:hypothetical protein